MDVHIWTPRALDWDDEEAAFAALVPDLKPKVRVWNATLSMSYQRFRSRVAAIARENHRRPLPPEVAWAAPQVRAMAELMREPRPV